MRRAGEKYIICLELWRDESKSEKAGRLSEGLIWTSTGYSTSYSTVRYQVVCVTVMTGWTPPARIAIEDRDADCCGIASFEMWEGLKDRIGHPRLSDELSTSTSCITRSKILRATLEGHLSSTSGQPTRSTCGRFLPFILRS